MAAEIITVRCSSCNSLLHEDAGCAASGRVPCVVCGSKARTFHVMINDTIMFREKIAIKGRHKDTGKPFIEQVHGDDLHRKTNKWMKLSRIIDRDNDFYHEIVTNPENLTIVHECKEPLSKHSGHGSAKPTDRK